jgi:hypothetical protein
MHNSVGMLIGCGLDSQGLGVRFLVGAGNFFLLHCVQTGSEAHLASSPMGTRALSPVVKWLGHEADHSPPSAEVNNAPHPNKSSWHGASINMDNLLLN